MAHFLALPPPGAARPAVNPLGLVGITLALGSVAAVAGAGVLIYRRFFDPMAGIDLPTGTLYIQGSATDAVASTAPVNRTIFLGVPIPKWLQEQGDQAIVDGMMFEWFATQGSVDSFRKADTQLRTSRMDLAFVPVTASKPQTTTLVVTARSPDRRDVRLAEFRIKFQAPTS